MPKHQGVFIETLPSIFSIAGKTEKGGGTRI